MSRIYISSSWKNPHHQKLVEALRQRGHKVYDFRHPCGREDRSVWEETGVTGKIYRSDGHTGLLGSELSEALGDERARKRFDEHRDAMYDADTCVLLLPSGRSSHLEAGYMKGLGKRVYVFGSQYDIHQPELMYLTLDGFFYLYDDLYAALDKPMPGVCRVCGCTWDNPCSHPDHGSCYWVEPSLCSHCASKEEGGLGIGDDPLTQHCINDVGKAFK